MIFYIFFLPKTSIFGRFCSEKSEIDFFLQQIDNVISYWGLITIFITNPKNFFFQNFCLNSVLRPPFPILLVSSTGVHFFHLKHAGSLKKNSPEDSAIHRAYVEDKRDKYIDAGVVFLAYVLRI